MDLITMAHLGEAQGIIEEFNLERKASDLFINETTVLLLTGEGPFEAAVKTALTIHQNNITNIINLGIAGSLNSELKVGEIFPVRTLYLVQDLKPYFKTFQSSETGVDCLTSFERILNPEKALILKGIGHLVDREAWGIAMAAKTAGIPFKSFKLISDMAGTLGACELVKETAKELSYKLSDFLKNHLSVNMVKEDEVDTITGFHFTFSTRHRFNTLLNKLAIKKDITSEEARALLPTKDLVNEKILPKERTALLLKWMEDKIDPVRKSLFNEKEKWEKDFIKNGFKVQTDPLWENSEITISFGIKSDEELNHKLEVLKHLSVSPFMKLMNGEFHVE
jgi:hypothetical protein